MLVLQKMERDEWHDCALFPFQENTALAMARARFVGQRLHVCERGAWRVVARGDSPEGSSPVWTDGTVLWAN